MRKGRRRRRRRDPARAYLDRLSPSGRSTQRSALRLLREIVKAQRGAGGRFPGWGRLSYQDASLIRTELIKRKLAPATVRRVLAALRGAVKEAWRLGMIDSDTYNRVCSIEGVPGRGLARGRSLASAEVEALFAACADDPRPVGARDGAALALMYAAGLRRQEAAHLRLDQVDFETGAVRLTETKRHEARVTFLSDVGLGWIKRWVEERGSEKGPLLYRSLPCGAVVPEEVSANALHALVERRSREAEIARCTPHDLRRTHVTALLDAGVDMLLVGRMVGHKHVDTTRLYDRRSEEAAHGAVSQIHVPSNVPRPRTVSTASIVTPGAKSTQSTRNRPVRVPAQGRSSR